MSRLSDLRIQSVPSLPEPVSFKPILQGLQTAMQPYADLQRCIRELQTSLPRGPELGAAVRTLVESQRQFAEVCRNLSIAPVIKSSGTIARHIRSSKALDDAGWLPHYSTPFDVVGAGPSDSDALHDSLTRHYQDRWPEVRQGIESRLTRYDVNKDSKTTFSQVLDAHEAGLYRCVCPVLVLEIERVSRVDLHGDKFKTITSQHALKKIAADLPISSIQPRGFFALSLYKRLSDHLYKNVPDEHARQQFAQDPVPNRHAAVHGYVVYSSMQHSLNMIFMAEYIFQVISFCKGSSLTQAIPEGC